MQRDQLQRGLACVWALACALAAGPALAAAGGGYGDDDASAAIAARPDYRLSSGLSEWSATPLSGTLVEGFAAVSPRQEFRLSAVAGSERIGWLEAFGTRLAPDLVSGLDRPRATYRYTWLSLPSWDFKVGLSATLDQFGPAFRYGNASADRLRFGNLPLMHLSGLGHVGDRWVLSLNADGLRTARGQALDFDVRVDYSLSRQFAVFGGYRLVDTAGDALDAYGSSTSNTANFGVRFRF
jgi:hypothetical protein